MKWAYYVKYKLKAAIVLFVILLGVLLNNLWERNNYSRLDESVSSIYKDRLLPSTYLFHISDHLYKKRMLQDHSDANALAGQKEHGEAIAALIKKYEATYLTAVERQQWQRFKTHLLAYSNTGLQANSQPQLLQKQFDQTIFCLQQLSDTQVNEGDELQKNSRAIVGSGELSAHLETVLVIALGLFTLVLLSVTDSRFFNKKEPTFKLN